MNTAARVDLMRAISQAYVNEIQPQTIHIYGSDVAICTWDVITGDCSKVAVFVHNGTSWCKASNGNKTLCTIAYYQFACRGWSYAKFHKKTGLHLDQQARTISEQQATLVIAEHQKRVDNAFPRSA